MMRHGVRFQPPLGGTLQLARTNAFFLGGGKALMNAYYRARRSARRRRRATTPRSSTSTSTTAASRRRPCVRHGVAARDPARRRVVAAAGGFESNLEWLREAWGPAADNFIIRGTPYNRGTRAASCCSTRARKPVGDPTQCHASRSTRARRSSTAASCTRVDCVSLGIVVNRDARALLRRRRGLLAQALRDLGPARRRAARTRSPTRSSTRRRWASSCRRCFRRSRPRSIARARARARARPAALDATVGAVQRRGAARHVRPHACSTTAAPRASRRRRRTGRAPIDTPPFFGYPLRPGITFTYLGVAVERARADDLQDDGAARATSSRPARSWPATSSARATWPASA